MLRTILQSLQLSCDVEKARRENAQTVRDTVSLLLQRPKAWKLLENWITYQRTLPWITTPTPFVVENLLQQLGRLSNTQYLKKVAPDFAMLYENMDTETANSANELLQGLIGAKAATVSSEVFVLCPICGRISWHSKRTQNETADTCKCGAEARLLRICHPTRDVQISAINGQLLEVFAARLLMKAGLEVIPFKDPQQLCYTSINYGAGRKEVEVDVVAIADERLILVECKMTKLTRVIVESKRLDFDELIKKIRSGSLPGQPVKLFIAFSLDANLPANGGNRYAIASQLDEHGILEVLDGS